MRQNEEEDKLDAVPRNSCSGDALDESALHALRDQMVDAAVAERLARTFKALSDVTRVRIVSLLVQHELCVHDLAKALGMSHSAVSHQLKTLREMRLVRFTKEGRHVYYTLDDAHIRDLFLQGLEHSQHQ